MDGQKTTLRFDTMPSSVRVLQCCLPCPSTSHMRTHVWISGSDVKSCCCYGLEYILDTHSHSRLSCPGLSFWKLVLIARKLFLAVTAILLSTKPELQAGLSVRVHTA